MPAPDPAADLTDAIEALIASLGQPREMTEADLPRLDALASAVVEHARALTLLLGTLPPDLRHGSILNAQEEARRIADFTLDAFHCTTTEADAYLSAAVNYKLAEQPA